MLRIVLGVMLLLVLAVGALFFFGQFSVPFSPPAVENTWSPQVERPPLVIGTYDVLGQVVPPEEAEALLATEEGRAFLSPENGAIQITEELISDGRSSFYLDTFGNEEFLTEIIGVMDGPVNLWTVSRAILNLRGEHTTNLRIPVDETFTVGGRTWERGSAIDTGLDVPPWSLLPLGMTLNVNRGKVQVGVSCALCHVTVDPDSGLIIEGATNTDIDTGMIMAMGTNSAAMFRHTDADPRDFPPGEKTFSGADGQVHSLPDRQAFEDAVDANLLAWPPGVFDTSFDLVSNPTFIPSAFTNDTHPYGWNGFASLGWFKGLTTLNNNVHAGSADGTAGAHLSPAMMGISEEEYLGVLLQNAASEQYRLPDQANPVTFLAEVNPRPEGPGVSEMVAMPTYPQTSIFMPFGLLASSPGRPFAYQINGMSAFQYTLAPPPNEPTSDPGLLEQGAQVFRQAGCADCHAGRNFTNHALIPLAEIGTQPSRAPAMGDTNKLFTRSQTYPPNLTVPLPDDAPVIPVPEDTTDPDVPRLAYILDDNEGGFKVMHLIGVYTKPPYLHDGGVAAGPQALREEGGRYVVADPQQLGMAGTLMRGIRPDPAASLRVLLDRRLREEMVAVNQAQPDLQATNIEGIGHAFWVDEEQGFSLQEQNALILFLLSIDDAPRVTP